MSIRPRLGFAIALLLAACASEGPKVPPGLEQAEKLPAKEGIPVLTRILMTALPADAKTWDRLLSERAVQVTEDGRIEDKQKLLESFKPFPLGTSGSIDVRDLEVSEFGDTAVAVFRSFEQETVFQQSIQVNYLSTHVWHRESGLWRLVAAHTMATPRDPPSLPTDLSELDAYAGTYQLASDRRYKVERRGELLFGGPEKTTLKPLIAVGHNVFAEPGAPIGDLLIFVDRPPGTVDRMVHRQKGADLSWLRVAGAPGPAAVKP
jgi:ketosteroid isomerase-like protein